MGFDYNYIDLGWEGIYYFELDYDGKYIGDSEYPYLDLSAYYDELEYEFSEITLEECSITYELNGGTADNFSSYTSETPTFILVDAKN